MRGVNKVTLLGNLGKDPECFQIEGNIAVAKFPLATTEKYKDRDGVIQSNTEWHNVVVWRGLAEFAEKRLQKGSLVYIEGKLKTRKWEDKQGQKRFMTEIIADSLIVLSKKKEYDYSDEWEDEDDMTDDFGNDNLENDFDSDSDDFMKL